MAYGKSILVVIRKVREYIGVDFRSHSTTLSRRLSILTHLHEFKPQFACENR